MPALASRSRHLDCQVGLGTSSGLDCESDTISLRAGADQADAIATLDLYVRALYHRSRPSEFDDIFKPAAVEQAVEKAVGRYNVAPTQQVAIIERTAEDERRALPRAGRWCHGGRKHQGKTAVDHARRTRS